VPLTDREKQARRWLWETSIASPDRSVQVLKDRLGVSSLDLVLVDSISEYLDLLADDLPELDPITRELDE
jgi:hypothetical protein